MGPLPKHVSTKTDKTESQKCNGPTILDDFGWLIKWLSISLDHGVFPLLTLVAWSRLLRSVAFRNERKGDAIHLRVGGCRAAWAYVPWCPKSLNFHGSPIAGWLCYVMMVEFMENPTKWHGCFRGMVDRGIQWQLLDGKLVWISSSGSARLDQGSGLSATWMGV